MAVHFTGPVLNKDKAGSGGLREWFSNAPSDMDPDYIKFCDDFISNPGSTNNDTWTAVTDTGATITQAASAVGGAVVFTASATAGAANGTSLQVTKENFKAASGKTIWFETKLKVGTAASTDLWVGLSQVFTTAAANAKGNIARIGFELSGSSASLICVTQSGSATRTTPTQSNTVVDSTDITLGFRVDQTAQVGFYVNRSLVATATTNIPTVTLTPSVMAESLVASTSQTATIDYISCVEIR